MGHVMNQTYLGFQPLSVGEGIRKHKKGREGETERGHVKTATSKRISRSQSTSGRKMIPRSIYTE